MKKLLIVLVAFASMALIFPKEDKYDWQDFRDDWEAIIKPHLLIFEGVDEPSPAQEAAFIQAVADMDAACGYQLTEWLETLRVDPPVGIAIILAGWVGINGPCYAECYRAYVDCVHRTPFMPCRKKFNECKKGCQQG